LGVPVYLNVNIMFVNRNLLKEAGLAYPSENWTKQQFLEYATKLTKKGAGQWGFDMGFTALDRNVTFIWNNGGEPHDPQYGPVVTKLTYDAPKTVEGLQFLHDLMWKHQVSPKNNDDRGGMSTADAFLNGKTAIRMDAASSSGSDLFNKAPASGLDWDFLPLPKGPSGHGARVSTDGYMIDKNKSPQEGDAAWQVLKELTSADTGVMRAQVQRQQPPRKSVQASFDKGYEGKTARLARIMADTSRPDPRAFWKDANQVGSMLGQHMSAAMVRNEVPLGTAMKAAMDEIRGYYGGK
jgi:ABC-type glycerol-3-phosphate transport system substrate-binding protein